jgi:capsular exopolysaccharide synthesis family protein
MSPEGVRDSSTLRHYLLVLRRRKWIVLAFVIAVPAAAYGLSHLQSAKYEASAQVLVSRQNLAASLTNTVDPSVYQQPDRVIDTQAQLAREPEVARRALAAAGVHRSPQSLLGASDVAAEPNVDLLNFSVRDHDPQLAARLVTAYATEFTKYRQELDTAALSSARKDVQDRLRALRAAGDHRSALYQSLADTAAKLRTMEALQTQNTYVVRDASGASKIQPRPVRNGVLGLLVGIFLGILAAFLREAFDTRVRGEDDITARLGIPLLGRLPRPTRRLARSGQLVMLEDPQSVHGEAFRMLRTNLEFMNLERDVRTIMITSAGEQEGKSTTTANLGIALARSGRRVVLVDLDLRRPFLARFFGLEGRAGLTDVALGHVRLDAAVATIPVPSLERASNGASPSKTVIKVLPAGTPPPDPGEFVGKHVIGELLEKLRDNADIVLVDSPPLLHVVDAITLSANVEGVLVVTRLKLLRRNALGELQRVLETLPCEKLGFVVTDADFAHRYGYGYYAAPLGRKQRFGGRRGARERIAERT